MSNFRVLMFKRFIFQDDTIAKRFIFMHLSKMWRENRCQLYNVFINPSLTKDENIINVPLNVSCHQWTSFYDLHQLPKMKVLLYVVFYFPFLNLIW